MSGNREDLIYINPHNGMKKTAKEWASFWKLPYPKTINKLIDLGWKTIWPHEHLGHVKDHRLEPSLVIDGKTVTYNLYYGDTRLCGDILKFDTGYAWNCYDVGVCRTLHELWDKIQPIKLTGTY
jgi:hypothetical protein